MYWLQTVTENGNWVQWVKEKAENGPKITYSHEAGSFYTFRDSLHLTLLLPFRFHIYVLLIFFSDNFRLTVSFQSFYTIILIR